jgi:tetratricopeptide (TPR) repeat protein
MKSNLASVLASLGKHDEANALYEALLPMFLETFGPHYPNTWNLMRSMAQFQARQGQPQQAVATLTRLLQFQRGQKPINAPAVTRTAGEVTQYLVQLNQRDRAEELLNEVLAELPPDGSDRQQVRKLLDTVRK